MKKTARSLRPRRNTITMAMPPTTATLALPWSPLLRPRTVRLLHPHGRRRLEVQTSDDLADDGQLRRRGADVDLRRIAPLGSPGHLHVQVQAGSGTPRRGRDRALVGGHDRFPDALPGGAHHHDLVPG